MPEPAEISQGERILCLDPFKDRDRIQEFCISLQQEHPHSFFVSWGWIDTWLRCLEGEPVQLVFIAEVVDGTPASCFFLGLRSGIERKVIFKQRAYLNETGSSTFDELTIEYNSVLGMDPGAVLRAVTNQAKLSHVEEVHFSAMPLSDRNRLTIPQNFALSRERQVPCHYVDLAKIRAAEGTYLDHLSANKRYQIRQSMRLYEASGPIQVREATSTEEALAMLKELVRLHQLEWTKRGQHGAFANAFLNNFHRSLVAARFEHGEIQILQVDSPQGAIGYLYNFIYNDEVLYYQSGFEYGPSRQHRPGLVCHYHAVNYNLARNRSRYNFLAGESQYKKSLATDYDELSYVVVAKKGIKLALESRLQTFWRSLRGKQQ